MHHTINRWLTTVALTLGTILMAAILAGGIYLATYLSQLYPFNPGTTTVTDSPTYAEMYPESYYVDENGDECFDPGGGIICVTPGE